MDRENGEYFHITSIHRDDIEDERCLGKPGIGKKLTDEDMRWIARKMADAYCDCCFWMTLKHYAESVLEEDEFLEGTETQG